MKWPRGGGLVTYQSEILNRIPVEKKVSVRGPHGLGKTMLESIAILWFSITRDMAGVDWKAPTTASVWRQLTRFLWPEIHKWARLLNWDRIGRDPFNERTELLKLNLQLRYGEAFALASDNATSIEGAHADHIFYGFDESKAISDDTFDSAEGAFSTAGEDGTEAYALSVSTPGEPFGRFYAIQSHKPGLEDWWARAVTVEEAIAAHRVTREWVEQRKRQWGEESAVFQNRVLGEFASSDEDGVIPLAWIEAANERWKLWDDDGRPALGPVTRVGVDVARSGEDQTVITLLHGVFVSEVRYSFHETTTQTSSRAGGVLIVYPDAIAVVDTDGLGAGVTDEMRDAGHTVLAFHGSGGTDLRDKSGELGFVNARAAAWWNLREMLDPTSGLEVALPPDDMLTGDLTSAHWRVASGSRIQIEAKDDIKKRLGRSPDSGDSVVMAFYTPPKPKKRGGIVYHGSVFDEQT